MLLVLLLATAGLLLAPQAAASGALQGLRACAARVIPALLPFFVVSRMLTALPLPTPGRRADRLFRALFGVRAACLPALLTGLLGGYPAGAAAVTELYRAGALSKAEAERALCFCNNSGPGFFAGLIGAAVLGDVRRGLILYGLHALSALMTTTMQEMRNVVEYAKEKGVTAKIMIGGAVITQDYADEIHADGYSRDAADAVRLAKRLVGMQE